MRRLIGIEIILNNSSGKFYFPNDNTLNGKRITAMSIPANPNDDLVSPSGKIVAPRGAINAAYFEIRKDSNEVIRDVPLKFFQETDSDRSLRAIDIDNFNPGSSFVILRTDPTTGALRYTVGTSIMLTIEYEG